jgi:ribokinase
MSKTTFDVISIGSATVDIFVHSKKLLLQKNSRFPSGQSLSLDYSSKNEIDKFLICSGGGATNSAVCFSRLGLKSAPLSLVGSDLLKNYVIADLKTDHVPDQFILSPKLEKTDFSVILVSSVGGRSILVNRGHTTLKPSLIPWSKIKKTSWFYLTSLEGNLDLLEQLIGFALENNIKIALNPGSREISQTQKLTSLLKHLDFLLLNQQEAEALLNTTFSQSNFFPRLQKLGPTHIGLTRGRLGAHILSADSNLFSPIFKSKAVEETGAGDTFGATFVSALIYRQPVRDALFWAMKNSASVVSHFGAKTGLLTLKQIKT